MGADKSLARPTSRCILFNAENISFDGSLVIYSETCLKRNLSITETCLQWEMFTVQRIWSPFDPNLKHLDKTEPACNGNNFRSLAVPLHSGFTVYINSTNIPPIMIINMIYENKKPSVAAACFLPGRAKDLSAPLYGFCFEQ